MNHEAIELPGESADSSFVRLSEDDYQAIEATQQQFTAEFAADAFSDEALPADSHGKPGLEDISGLVQDNLDWLNHNSDEFALGDESDAKPDREVQAERTPQDPNSIMAAEMAQVNAMQMQQTNDFLKARSVAATLADKGDTVGHKKLGEAKALQKKMDAEIQHEEKQVSSMMDQHARDVVKRNRKRAAKLHTAVMVDHAQAKVRQTQRKVQKQVRAEKKVVRKKFEKKAHVQEKKDTEASKVVVHKLAQKHQIERSRIQAVSDKLKTHGAATSQAVVVQDAQAEEALEASQDHHKIQTMKLEAAVRKDIPLKLPGLEKHLKLNKALPGTNTKEAAHPFKEAAMRQAGVKYNKMRKRVVALNDRLSKLEQEAADASAKKKYEQDKEASEEVLVRQRNEAADELSLARFPEDYRAKIKAMQREVWETKMKQFHKEKQQALQKEVVQDEQLVEEDQEQIAAVKQRLKRVLHRKLAPVQASILQEANVELDSEVAEGPMAQASDTEAMADADEAPADADDEEDSPEAVIELLAREVGVLQKQQAHLVSALASKRMAEGVASTAAHEVGGAVEGQKKPKELLVSAQKPY
jgi:hypothetical protein